MGFDRHVVWWCMLSLLLAWTTPTGLGCIPVGLPSEEELMSAPQGSTHPAMANRQWIFPSLQFTCTASVIAWVFTVEAADSNVVCPTLELWKDNEFTPTSFTDYLRTEILTPENYAQPEALSDTVYRCTLLTSVVVHAGTILGFRTISQSDSVSTVQLLERENSPVGYNRNIGTAATLFDVDSQEEIDGSVPLIVPVIVTAVETSAQTSVATSLTSSVQHLSPSNLLQPSHSTPQSTPTPPSVPLSTPTPPSIPLSTQPSSSIPQSTAFPLTLAPTAASENPTVDSSPKKSATPTIVAIVTTTGILLVLAATVLVLVVILLARQRRKTSQPSKTIAENGTSCREHTITVPGQMKTEKTRVRSKNNYTFTSSHIYEDVDGMSFEHKKQQHDYDFINSVRVATTDDPKNYEVPQPSPSKLSSSSQYEVPGDIVDRYETPMNGVDPGTLAEDSTYDTPMNPERNATVGESGYDIPMDAQGPIKRNVTAVECGYDIPIDAQGPLKRNATVGYDTPIDAQGPVGESGYYTPIDGQALFRGNTVMEDSMYDTPVDASEQDSGVYEVMQTEYLR